MKVIVSVLSFTVHRMSKHGFSVACKVLTLNSSALRKTQKLVPIVVHIWITSFDTFCLTSFI